MDTSPPELIDSRVTFFTPIVSTKKYLKPILLQAEQTNKKFPLKGIEHKFCNSNNPILLEGKEIHICKYCGYPESNLMHPEKNT